jgi:hypothetical protein
VSEGKIGVLVNKSGHYKPGPAEILKVLQYLRVRGVDLRGFDFVVMLPPKQTKLGAGGGAAGGSLPPQLLPQSGPNSVVVAAGKQCAQALYLDLVESMDGGVMSTTGTAPNNAIGTASSGRMPGGGPGARLRPTPQTPKTPLERMAGIDLTNGRVSSLRKSAGGRSLPGSHRSNGSFTVGSVGSVGSAGSRGSRGSLGSGVRQRRRSRHAYGNAPCISPFGPFVGVVPAVSPALDMRVSSGAGVGGGRGSGSTGNDACESTWDRLRTRTRSSSNPEVDSPHSPPSPRDYRKDLTDLHARSQPSLVGSRTNTKRSLDLPVDEAVALFSTSSPNTILRSQRERTAARVRVSSAAEHGSFENGFGGGVGGVRDSPATPLTPVWQRLRRKNNSQTLDGGLWSSQGSGTRHGKGTGSGGGGREQEVESQYSQETEEQEVEEPTVDVAGEARERRVRSAKRTPGRATEVASLSGLPVAKLKSILKYHNLDVTGCIEKSDLVDRILTHRDALRGACGGGARGVGGVGGRGAGRGSVRERGAANEAGGVGGVVGSGSCADGTGGGEGRVDGADGADGAGGAAGTGEAGEAGEAGGAGGAGGAPARPPAISQGARSRSRFV